MAGTTYEVAAPLIVVRIPGAQGGESYVRRGRILPASVEQAEIQRLLERGLIEEAIDETALVVEIDAAAATATAREAAEVARAEAQRIFDEELAPEFDQRVQAAAEKLVAEQRAAAEETPPAGQPIEIPAGDPKNSWTEAQIDAYGARMDPPLIFGNGTKAEKLAAIAEARKS